MSPPPPVSSTVPPLDGSPPPAEIPRSFWQYVRSFGPGFIAVLTWLGAGDIVSAGVAGGNYGYALAWAMVLALAVRYAFVSMIARFQLCNPRGEGVLDGLVRFHRYYGPFLFVAVLFWGHLSTSYMLAGVGEISAKIFGFGGNYLWQIFWVAIVVSIIFRPAYHRAELLFKFLLALLAASFLGCAIWVGLEPVSLLKGVFAFDVPADTGPFGALVVALGMIGAVGGSLVNLVYPYFLEQKGWKGPEYRRVQRYDFLLAIIVLVVFNLAVWTLGAELVFKTGGSISSIDDMAVLLGGVLGEPGRILFLLGVFAAVFTSILGAGLGLAYLGSHAWYRWRSGHLDPLNIDFRNSKVYRYIVLWIIVSPLIWGGKAEFISLTLIANTFTVVLIPAISGGLWWITARADFIGAENRNRWWENAIMASVFLLALYGMVGAARSIITQIGNL
ncbi:MAG: divalent metal cation transporter [Opitutaceae bacterium]